MTGCHPDGMLVLRLQGGEIEALGELYELYKNRIFRAALAITRDRQGAEDVLQEAFLRLFTHVDQIRTDVPVGPWLYRVTVNLSCTWLQKRRRRFPLLDSILDQLAAPLHLSPERLVERGEVYEAVQRAIANLPLSHRIVVVLFYLEGLNLSEIAEVVEIPEGTVKSRLYYARESLKELMAGRKPLSEVLYEFT
ncbi:MAG: sigma-70 family RNA polymerase sigma factor [Anaerolineae bacterium]|nr:sigma-70 family RNA polymerase sigma factor [Anaerolineae bacterium]